MSKKTTITTIFSQVILLFIVSASLPIGVSHGKAKRVWSVSEILSARNQAKKTRSPRYCQGRRFTPCICAADVPGVVQYRPAVSECQNKAAIVLSGRYKDIFSVVVRDSENRDRWPPQGINRCTPFERDVLALHKCSAFKTHKVLNYSHAEGDATVHCLGARGYSRFFRKVVRMTAKLADIPNSSNDPIVRWCLSKPGLPLN